MPVKVLSRGLCLPDLVAGDNEIEQHRNFSETHFPGVAPCRFRLDGQEFLNDAAAIGVSVFELTTMQVRHHVYMENCPDCPPVDNIIRMWS